MTGMFDNAKFRGDISNWKINPEINIEKDFFRGWRMKDKPQFKVNEAFDFNSINKKKKSINLYKSLPQILEKVKIFNIAGITPDEYNILSSCIGVYKVITTL